MLNRVKFSEKAKLIQPSGNVYSCAACAILFVVRADGRLAMGSPVVELSSGNMVGGVSQSQVRLRVLVSHFEATDDPGCSVRTEEVMDEHSRP
jgi:hypothetical protein